ncbi:Lsr2 family protein [Streptomyces sp. SID14515]|uniref:histone-like nucleoid-structuring protein Lsr2 n=1 Tax=Streptomyces sp. SID14515 TaxID=2706074 RepID=UPI0013C58824|nr:Lsr2 family protein [Streptomyces sp. SID14515]NEB42573.1 Lsr2 family protein [Streptomyces sp. SID14515]
MAQKIVTTFTDDLTGKEGEDVITQTFALNGSEYEIDLSEANRAKLAKALKPFVDAGRKARKSHTGAASSRSGRRAPGSKHDTAEMRKWARENGYNVNDRGRVPAEIVEAYEKASK